MGRRKKKGKRSVEEEVKEPRSIVVSRGQTSTTVQRLKRDLRRLLSPNTGRRIKERRFNKTRDFLEVCSPLGVSHVLAFFTTESNTNLKIIKTPQGPTISFRMVSYSLMSDVQRSHQRSFDVTSGSQISPLILLTNFKKTKEHEVMTTMLRNMFPAVDTQRDITARRRVVLFDYDPAVDLIRARHYLISIPVSGLSKAMHSLVYGHHVPDLGDVDQLDEFLSKSGYGTESEGEEALENQIEIEDKEAMTRRVKLKEIGPRMDLMLYKIEQGTMEGLVLYNKFVEKTMEEVAATQRHRDETEQLRIFRRKKQEQNIERKRKAQEKQKQKPLENEVPVEDKKDEEYYREEVGLEPDDHFGAKKKVKHL